jgi:hypothetical protein
MLTPKSFAEKFKGPSIVTGVTIGWWLYRMLFKRLDHLPRIPPRYWPGIFVSMMLMSAVLDFSFNMVKEKSKSMDGTGRIDKVFLLPEGESLLPWNRAVNAPGIAAKTTHERLIEIPKKIDSEIEEARVEVQKIRDEMKKDGSSNPIPYFWKTIQERWARDNAGRLSSAEIEANYQAWLDSKKGEYDALMALTKEEEAYAKKKAEMANTIIITAAGKKDQV